MCIPITSQTMGLDQKKPVFGKKKLFPPTSPIKMMMMMMSRKTLPQSRFPQTPQLPIESGNVLVIAFDLKGFSSSLSL